MNRRPARSAGLAVIVLAWLLALAPAFASAPKVTVTYVYTNPQGTPLARADADGTILARYDYTPYGQAVGGPLPAGPGYTGHVNDPDTGLVYMQQRYYDPEVGRFLSMDPVGPTPGDVFNFGRYVYANNNPYTFTDPDGRQSAEDYQNLHRQQQGSPVPLTLVPVNGHWQVVPTAVVSDVMLAQAAHTTLDGYTAPVTREGVASGLENIQTTAGGVEIVTAVDAPPASAFVAAVGETSGLVALMLSPSMDRLLNVATLGLFKGGKLIFKESKEGVHLIHTMEQTSELNDIQEKMNEYFEKQKEEEHERRRQQQ